MEIFNDFQLFSFLPLLAIAGVFWYERVKRHGAQKRTTYLFASMVVLALAGLVQSLPWFFKSTLPFAWPQVFVVAEVLYFLALILLEYGIHVKRIEESFLMHDFKKGLQSLQVWFIALGVLIVLVLAGSVSWQWDHNNFPLNILLDDPAKFNPLIGYTNQMKVLALLFSIVFIVIAFQAARSIFNLQEGVIRRRGYPFYAQIVVVLIQLLVIMLTPAPVKIEDAAPLPLYWFGILNLIYIIRLIEEFFLWAQYNLRSDKAKMEQRQHTQNLLIRRVIGAAESDDKAVVREIVEAALEKAKGRLVVKEYQMTGMTVYRAVGNMLKVEDISHVVGYATPLSEKSIKNLDKSKLADTVLRTTYDLAEIRETPVENLKEFGKRLIKEAFTTRQPVVSAEVPEGLKGLQRLVVVVPIMDADLVLGFLTVFKDSFDRMYPAERDVLNELSENLATVFALMAGKEIQRERNRLQGEMNTAREIQTSILPKNPKVPGFQVGTYMETATEVGGDVFDFIPTPYGTYFGIGDVAGHGLPAGMMAVISVAALHGALDASKVLGKALPLDQVYDTVNRVLCTLNRDRIGSDKFMTQNHFVANGNKIEHVGTHMVAALWKAKTQSIQELTDLTNKTGFLGLSEFMASAPSHGSFTMDKDDVLVLYSDGVSEAKNGNGTMFGLDGIKHALAEFAEKTPQELITGLLEDLKRHASTGDFKKHSGHYTDDVSLVILKKE